MNHRHRTIISIAAAALVFVATASLVRVNAQGPDGNNPPCDYYSPWRSGGMMGQGGMMGGGGVGWNNVPNDCLQASWYGMGITGGMMGYSGMGPMMMSMMMGGWDQYGQFGPGSGMMGAWTPPNALRPNGQTLTLDEAVAIADAYIAQWHTDQPLALGEVMQFTNNFYGEAVESGTGHGAFEFLIDPQTGIVVGEPGPNMMWNVRYGMNMMMGAGLWQPAAADAAAMPVTVQQAHDYAQAYLDNVLPGAQAEDGADTFYGYYTLHILRDGQIIGMLSVNGYSGQVWLHHWHGDYITMTGQE